MTKLLIVQNKVMKKEKEMMMKTANSQNGKN